MAGDFVVSKLGFNDGINNELHNFHQAKNMWPIVYMLSDHVIKEAYVGETTDAYARMNSHIKNGAKNRLDTVHLITSDKFNKSATLDIESNLIKYISGDGQYKLLNANIGLANHNFYEKDYYWDLFRSLWSTLKKEGIAKHSLEQINNSDLFKYSPYKSLSADQRKGLLMVVKNLLNDQLQTIIIEGGAGTGKTILAIFLFKLLCTDIDEFNFRDFGNDELEFIDLITQLKVKYPKPKMALVIPMSSFRGTIKKVFKNVKGLNANMVIGPAELTKEKFDIVFVDESHRLRRRVNLGAYYGSFDAACAKLGLDRDHSSELDWVLQQSAKTILFYDENQSIKPSDVKSQQFEALKGRANTRIEYLSSQFRVKGGNAYVQYLDKLLNCKLKADDKIYNSKDFDFLLFDSIQEMVGEIKLRNAEDGLSRLIAGYSWEWKSKKNKEAFDIQIGGLEMRWNSVAEDWVNSENSVNEVGCIHTTQGYDLNYAGIILGNEISYDEKANEIVVLKQNYFDKNGKNSIKAPNELKAFIINIYKTIMLRGIKGTYLYVCDPDLRKYISKHVLPYINKDVATTGI